MHTYECNISKLPDAKKAAFTYIKQGFESRNEYPKTTAGLKEATSNRELYIKDAFITIDSYNQIALNPYKQVELWEKLQQGCTRAVLLHHMPGAKRQGEGHGEARERAESTN